MKNSVDQTLADDMACATNHQKIGILFDYMVRTGQSFYDESVTQLEHALQCANQARISKATPAQITSALLHDLGHFLLDEHDADKAFLADDLNHEAIGADFLKAFFPDAVTTPVRLHVPAKRYLCTTDAAYYDGLSEASKRSFRLQGGVMSDDERSAFERIPYSEDALNLRRWDDLSKVKNLETPGLQVYREVVENCLR
jgi:phosphonate degradation associated HDIG domain protein